MNFKLIKLTNPTKAILKWVNIFLTFEIIVISGIFINQSEFFGFNLTDLIKLGKLFGTLAALVFIATITPGIIRRFKLKGLLKDLQIYGTGIRAHTGVLMFLLAFAHYVFVKIIPLFPKIQEISEVPVFEYFGLLALYFCIPLAFTSNLYLKKKMKKNWNRLHSLVYLIVWFIFLHVALVGELGIAILIGLTAILETLSLIYEKLEKTK